MKKFKFNEILPGERIILQKHAIGLAPTMFDYVDRDRERLDRFLPWVANIKTVADEIKYIQFTHDSWEKMTFFDYGILRKEDSVYIGNIGVHTLAWDHDWCEVGYWLIGDFEGQGYMSEAVKVLETYLFEEGFNRVQIKCSNLNARSANIPLYNHYMLEGSARQDIIEKGAYRDTKIFAKLTTDFVQQNGPILIRRARHLDANGIIQAHVRSIREICAKDYTEAQVKAWSGRDFQASVWQKTIDNDHVWVLDDCQTIQGFGHLNIHHQDLAEIRGLYFTPQATRQGLGHQLITKIKAFVRRKKIKTLILSATMSAKRFYQRQGFQLDGAQKSIMAGGQPIGCYPMKLTLPDLD